jgi:hypothetical protein
MEHIDLNHYYADVALKSGYLRFGLWAPARLPEGEHRFVVVKVPDSYTNHARLAEDIAQLQELNPGENVFVAGTKQQSENDDPVWWPMGIITPHDFTIAFRYRNGLHNPMSGQALRYSRARRKQLGS